MYDNAGMQLNRREFLEALAVTAVAADVGAQPSAELWGGPVLDCHLHLRADAEANVVHMDGCGVAKAVILARDANDRARAFHAKYPRRIVWAASTDVATPGADARLTQAVKGGALGFGELKSHVEADGPELQVVYALAAELHVPVLVHFQEVEHFAGEGLWGTGFKRFETMLMKFPQTQFIGHADAFWANVDAKYANEASYPTGPITRGGITDKLLGDHANLFGDLSANSGNNAMSRDAEFTRDFLQRHQNKLIFGSDCACADGHGAGTSQSNNPAAARMFGKCVARETLTLLRASTTPEVFRKITWANGHALFRIGDA
jgi:predicted TIM-barrel fold metal-dependent hydrolase